ncbi:MAG: methionine gamma-lyase family protein [Oscillospiraceae bacterium]|nr:methionine gamma-lyase family protein [Oscillospiraceae bacterium]
MNDIDNKVLELSRRAEDSLAEVFKRTDEISQHNTAKVLSVFRENRVCEADFAGSTGYGYGDRGRDKLDSVCAGLFRAKDGILRTTFVSGTHAIACALFGVMRPGKTLVSAIGAPYDTLQTVIGLTGGASGSLKEFGVSYAQADTAADGSPDHKAIAAAVSGKDVGAVLVQRSRGYSTRDSLSVDAIADVVDTIRKANPDVPILVDNCYGEFVEETEPIQAGADLVMGSLIKNMGGGLAPTGGYVAGREDLVEMTASRMTVPGLGREVGASLETNRSLYQGLFFAPHVTAQAIKTAAFCAAMMEQLGYETLPRSTAVRSDITQMIKMGSAEALKKFCLGIQMGAPVDSFVTPEPWDMPGYDDKVIMAAGAFIQGASIELSCDGPMREPFMAYMQGGLTYESGKLGVMLAVNELLKK